jgi:RHS repeat-associated protein
MASGQKRYVYDGMRVMQERNAGNAPTVSYSRGQDLGGSLESAGGIGGLLGRTRHAATTPYAPTGTSCYHADGNGNVTYLADATGTADAAYRYDPFGRTLASGGAYATANTYRYSSKEAMPGGLIYYGYRFYEPQIQRWLSRDPIEEQGGLNLYAYVANNPVSRIDPLGLKAWKCKKPLHALGGTGERSGPDVPGNPLYHEYYCVEANGQTTCYGQDRQNGPWGPGKPSNDSFDPNNCKEIPSNGCIEDCLKKKGGGKRPGYGLCGPGTNCQEWANDAIDACNKECEPKKPQFCPINIGNNAPPVSVTH